MPNVAQDFATGVGRNTAVTGPVIVNQITFNTIINQIGTNVDAGAQAVTNAIQSGNSFTAATAFAKVNTLPHQIANVSQPMLV